MEFPIKKLLKYSESFEPLVWWENLFGRAFAAIRPFLAPCEDRRGDFYPSPDNPSVQLAIQESGRRYRALPPEELADEVDDLILDWEDVQAYRFSCTRLRAALRKVFRLIPAAGRQIANLCYIGRCECNKEFRHVYACLAVSDQGALQAAENCTDPKRPVASCSRLITPRRPICSRAGALPRSPCASAYQSSRTASMASVR